MVTKVVPIRLEREREGGGEGGGEKSFCLSNQTNHFRCEEKVFRQTGKLIFIPKGYQRI